jgi:two-component system invasion response regulator UvrY
MIKVVIIDDHQLIREGLARLISNQKDITITGSFSSVDDYTNKFNPDETDVVILDLSLPDGSGLDILRELKSLSRKLHVLILSMYDEEQYAVRSLKAGASGYITKGNDSKKIIEAVRKIYQDGVYISPEISEKLAKDLSSSGGFLPHENLSEREFQILVLIGKGLSTKAIGKQLFISDNTVRTYRSRIFKKMNFKSTSELIHYTIKHNLL